VFTAKELFQFPVAVWFRNFLVTPVVLLLYLNPLIIFLAYPIRFPKLKDRTVLFMIWLFIPIAITIFIGKNILARYYIIGMIGILPLLAVMTAIFFNRVKWKFAPVVAFCLFSIWGLFFIVNPAGYFHLFPNAVHEQNYAISWTSGYGIPELVSWIDTHVPHDKILLLAVADSPGNPSDYLLTYYYFKPYVRIIFATMTNIHDFRKLEPITEKGSLYLATRLSLITPETQPYLTPIIIFNKPYNEDAIGLYQISFTASH
jgi:hypothetical protein